MLIIIIIIISENRAESSSLPSISGFREALSYILFHFLGPGRPLALSVHITKHPFCVLPAFCGLSWKCTRVPNEYLATIVHHCLRYIATSDTLKHIACLCLSSAFLCPSSIPWNPRWAVSQHLLSLCPGWRHKMVLGAYEMHWAPQDLKARGWLFLKPGNLVRQLTLAEMKASPRSEDTLSLIFRSFTLSSLSTNMQQAGFWQHNSEHPSEHYLKSWNFPKPDTLFSLPSSLCSVQSGYFLNQADKSIWTETLITIKKNKV